MDTMGKQEIYHVIISFFYWKQKSVILKQTACKCKKNQLKKCSVIVPHRVWISSISWQYKKS